MTLRFVCDQFRWAPDSRRFHLLEPPSLFFDDPPDRVIVQAWRHREGWQLVYTHHYEEAGQLGVADLWSRVDEPDSSGGD